MERFGYVVWNVCVSSAVPLRSIPDTLLPPSYVPMPLIPSLSLW